MKITITTEDYYSPPSPEGGAAKPLTQIKRFEYGDTFVVKSTDTGFPVGEELPLLGYSNSPDAGMCIIVAGSMPKGVREYSLNPTGVIEVMFRRYPDTIGEYPLDIAQDLFDRIPAKAAKAVQEEETKIIPMPRYWEAETVLLRAA